ncbi:amidohydrolase family protein [Mycolicibacterium septicum]|uniref:amidohydrolase family protein n=1 Tax=Mycolicibacterium septicum TaxID=98668 RepID=UPI002361E529|nr:amidohydrolase family protein [Mycolicibacterium septicum]
MHTHAVDPLLPDLSSRHPDDSWPAVRLTTDTDAVIIFGGRPYRRIDDRCWSAATRIADMDRSGVALQVLSPIPVTFCYDADPAGVADLCAAQNDFFARMTLATPARFAALGAVPLQDPDLAVEELRACMARPGFLGVEIATQVRGRGLGDEMFDRFFAVAAELGALVLVHPSDQDLLARLTDIGIGFGAGMPVETGMAGAALIASGALLRRPNTRICLAHGAGVLPSLIGRLDKGALIAGASADSAHLPSRQARGLWCDSLTYNRSALLAAVDTFGADHVVLGSDYPFPAMPEPLDDVVADLPMELRRKISRTNVEGSHGALSRPRNHALPPVGRH